MNPTSYCPSATPLGHSPKWTAANVSSCAYSNVTGLNPDEAIVAATAIALRSSPAGDGSANRDITAGADTHA
jgi:hypothetical protein